MSWKKGRPMAHNEKTGRLRSMSITTRLNFLFTLSGISILLLTTYFFFWVLTNAMQEEDNATLVQKTGRLQKALTKHDIHVLEREMVDSTEFHSLVFRFRILDEQGDTLLESPGMQDFVPKSVFPAPRKGLAELKGGEKWTAHDGKVYLLGTIWTEVRMPSPRKAIFQAAYDVTGDYHLIAESSRKLGVMFILGVLFFLGVGTLIARKGLGPLREITERLKKITASHLKNRIAADGWPKELRALSVCFDEMIDRLDHSFTRLSQFSSDLAHELRTPVTNLMGEAEVALSKPRTPEEYREVIESSLEEYERLSRLIESLLFLARAENTETRIEFSLFEASDEVNKVCDYHRGMAEEQGVDLACSGKGFLSADRVLFRQAVANLLSNAICYTPSGGKVEVFVRQSDDRFLEIIVSDTGSGINPAHMPYIFNRFFRGDRALSRYPKGTGLGLSIVKSIMAIHAGTVSIQSEPGRGTSATLRFSASPSSDRKCT